MKSDGCKWIKVFFLVKTIIKIKFKGYDFNSNEEVIRSIKCGCIDAISENEDNDINQSINDFE